MSLKYFYVQLRGCMRADKLQLQNIGCEITMLSYVLLMVYVNVSRYASQHFSLHKIHLTFTVARKDCLDNSNQFVYVEKVYTLRVKTLGR